jgi:hypothetical protein
VEATFAEKPTASELVEVEAGEARVSFGVLDASGSAPAFTDGNALVYPNVYPGADLRFEVRGDILKESIILEEPPAEPTWATSPRTKLRERSSSRPRSGAPDS